MIHLGINSQVGYLRIGAWRGILYYVEKKKARETHWLL